MAWATPRTWVTGEVVTSANMNTHIRDELLETAPAKATTAGDMFYATGPNTLTTLPISGAARKSLAANTTETALEYIDSLESLIQAQGDIIYGASANTPARLPKGSARQGLAMNSAATTPQWVATPQSLMTAQGDIIQASSANNPARLALGTAGQKMVVNSGATALEYISSVGATTVTEFLSGRHINDPTWTEASGWIYSRVSTAESLGFAWVAPDNFASLTSMKLVMMPDATETIQADLGLSISAPGELQNNDTEAQLNQTLSVTINVLTEWDVGTYFSGLSDITAGDYVALICGSDTSALRVVGLRIVWVTT